MFCKTANNFTAVDTVKEAVLDPVDSLLDAEVDTAAGSVEAAPVEISSTTTREVISLPDELSPEDLVLMKQMKTKEAISSVMQNISTTYLVME